MFVRVSLDFFREVLNSRQALADVLGAGVLLKFLKLIQNVLEDSRARPPGWCVPKNRQERGAKFRVGVGQTNQVGTEVSHAPVGL